MSPDQPSREPSEQPSEQPSERPSAGAVPLRSLSLGTLLAEGGEGRVFEVRAAAGPPGWPAGASLAGRQFVYKQFRLPRPCSELGATVAFPSALQAVDGSLAARLRASCAWPASLVLGDDPLVALGVLVPRAPGAFWLRHRQGAPRLATLSYLASDPDRIAVAYGAVVPAPGTAARVAVVYALARLLEAWQGAGAERAVHGDLSAKNVLWSLHPVPAVYVLDCDGARVVETRDEEEGTPRPDMPRPDIPGPDMPRPDMPRPDMPRPDMPRPDMPRPTTPNWEDPALPPGASPTTWSDRYALGLAFLRVVGAAHFPLQGRQRAAGKVNVDLLLPRSWRRLPDMPGLWEMCERSLSLADTSVRPSPGEWAAELEALLSALGADGLATRVREGQGDPRPSLPPAEAGARRRAGTAVRVGVPDVEVRPVLRHRPPSTWRLVNAAAPAGQLAGHGATSTPLGPGVAPREILRRAGRAWAGAHSLSFRLLRSPGRRRDGFRRLFRVLVVDFVGACVALFLFGEIVSPWINI